MDELMTTLETYRPSGQWTVLFNHRPYGAALWSLLFDPAERLLASEHFGDAWPRISADAVITDHIVGYQTSAGEAKERLVRRLEPVHRFPEAWRVFSLTRALALSLSAVPAEWPLRLDASRATVERGGRYGQLMDAAVRAAAQLATEPPRTDNEALGILLAMSHGMNPETALVAADGATQLAGLPWPADGASVRRELLGDPVECPTSHVETMTRARRKWEAAW